MAKKDLFERWVEAGDKEAETNLAVIQSLSMQGKSLTDIADHFEISKRTLLYLQKKHPAIAHAIKTGRASVVAMCQNKLMEKVSEGDTTAIIYALKVYGGDFFNDRKAPTKTEISGTPISVEPKVQVYIPATDPDPDTEMGDKDGKNS